MHDSSKPSPAPSARAVSLGTLCLALAACSSSVGDAPTHGASAAPPSGAMPTSPASAGLPTASPSPEPAAPPLAGAPAPGPSDSSGWCAALGVFQRNCQSCHGDELKAGAPMPLTSYGDLRARAVSDTNQAVYQRVQSRIHDPQRPMPPSGMPAADIALLDEWLGKGAAAPEDPSCGGPSPALEPEVTPEFQWPSDCQEFYTLTTSNQTDRSKKYSVAPGGEEHPQFIFDAPWGEDNVQVLAYRPITDNAKVLHHWILYENASTGIFAGGLGGKFLVGWAPGSQGNTEGMPPDVGLYMPGGKQSLRLDVHYYNLGSTQAELDQSGLELCITRTPRKYTATVVGLTGNATAKVGRSDNATSCTAATTADVHFLSVSPHMHKLGVHAKLEQTRNGQTTALHDAPFDFNDQRVWPLDDLPIQNGDVLTTTCSYENDTGKVVTFGQNSDDEMCFNFVTYYPMGAFSCGLTL